MSKTSRVGQRFPLREEPLAPIPEDSSTTSSTSERSLRIERRAQRLQEAQNESLMTTTTTSATVTTPVIRPFTATQQRLRASAEPEQSTGQPLPRSASAAPSTPNIREGGTPPPSRDPGEPGDPDEPVGRRG